MYCALSTNVSYTAVNCLHAERRLGQAHVDGEAHDEDDIYGEVTVEQHSAERFPLVADQGPDQWVAQQLLSRGINLKFRNKVQSNLDISKLWGLQSNLDISNSDISNSAKLEASF